MILCLGDGDKERVGTAERPLGRDTIRWDRAMGRNEGLGEDRRIRLVGLEGMTLFRGWFMPCMSACMSMTDGRMG